MNRRQSQWAIGCVAAVGLAGAALGQQALGDGTALDANLMVDSGGRNPTAPDFLEALRFRNAIVTGNAPSGLAFRGDVGYLAPGEFTAPLGANELYTFRRDSLYSGLSGMGIRGTEALQYQFALTVGQTRPPTGLAGSLAVPRSGTGGTAETVGAPTPPVASVSPLWRLDPTDPAVDRRGNAIVSLRSPSAYMSTRGSQPTLVGVRADQEGRALGITASPLEGIMFRPLSAPAVPAAPAATVPTPTGPDSTGAPVSPYQSILDRLARQLEGVAPPPDEPGTIQRTPAEAYLESLRRSLRLSDAPRPGEPAERAEPFDPDTLRILRRAAGQVPTLAPVGAPAGFDAFTHHMQLGQQLLQEGQHFDAEARFALALSLRPDDVMAAVGRVHAQIGAGLYLSAAVNLRELLTNHPELITTRFGADVMPQQDRLRMVRGDLVALADQGGPRGRQAALLLAYLGYQSGDTEAIRTGLAAMQPDDEDAPPDRLLALLRSLWLDVASAEDEG